MDFDNPKVYDDTSIIHGLVMKYLVPATESGNRKKDRAGYREPIKRPVFDTFRTPEGAINVVTEQHPLSSRP